MQINRRKQKTERKQKRVKEEADNMCLLWFAFVMTYLAGYASLYEQRRRHYGKKHH